jgi:hypothetical protein
MSTDIPEDKTSRTRAQSPNTRHQVTVRLPGEFKALCERDGITMWQLLQSFAADLCGLAPLTKITKYRSRGPAAQAAARAYYEATGYGAAARERKEQP